MQQISKHVFQISLGSNAGNVFIIEDNGLTLIDTGRKKSAGKIFSALKYALKDPDDIKQIILTHCHSDNAGSAAYIKNRLDVPVMAHIADTKLIELGIAGRQPMFLTPGFSNWFKYNMIIKPAGNKIAPVYIDKKLEDNDIIHEAAGLKVIHTPGHSAGHISLLIKDDGVLIAGDICTNASEPELSTLYEDRELALQSILKVADLEFDKAVFTHGKPLLQSANKKLGAKFGKKRSLLRRA